ncbi:DUF427-domain-containing protein [Thozetella sp. PMI_491]|nr:DUF427-domain-containing protein [Thozetella sp. PMI_491]
MPPPPRPSFAEVAAKIATEGPHQHEPTNRRIRGRVGAEWAFDTHKAEFVWEHPYYPNLYIPLDALQAGPGAVSQSNVDQRGFWTGSLAIAGKSLEIAGFEQGPLKGLVKIAADAVDAWFAEDEQQLGPHPKDPYKRIEPLSSSREVRVEVDGTVIARSTNNVFLYETKLRPRYYLAPTTVEWSFLTPSDTKTSCPYKGEAHYYHLKVGEKEIKDAIWYYPAPFAESAAILNRLCFYNEKVDIFIDGEKEQK